MNAAQLTGLLTQAKGRAERNLWFGALLAREAETVIVIVGGSAIEVYTSGRYVSSDLDLVGARDSIIPTLEVWGFQREGRLWYRRDLELWIDPVGRTYTGDERRLRRVSTPYGPVFLASVEDLIAKRLIEIKVWPRGSTSLFEQAIALASEYSDAIDWEYVRSVARRDGAEDLVPELRRRILPPTDRQAGPAHPPRPGSDRAPRRKPQPRRKATGPEGTRPSSFSSGTRSR